GRRVSPPGHRRVPGDRRRRLRPRRFFSRTRQEPAVRQRDQHHPGLHQHLHVSEAVGSNGDQVHAPHRADHRAGHRTLARADGAAGERDEMVRRGEEDRVSPGTRASRPHVAAARDSTAGGTPAFPGMWPLRIALSKLRPFNAAMITRTLIVLALFAAFLYGDFALFRRLFAAMVKIEETTPFFALGLLR